MVKGLIICAGAQGRITAEIWRRQEPDIELAFLDDDPALHNKHVSHVPVAGAVTGIATHLTNNTHVVIALGKNPVRVALANEVATSGVRWGTVVDPSAVVQPSATIGDGTVILAHAIINTDARIGRHVIVNNAVVVEHDTTIEDGVSLGTGLSMGGRVAVEEGAFISAGVVIAPRIRIGAGAIIGAGAVVVKDVPPGTVAYGVPARPVRDVTDADWDRLL